MVSKSMDLLFICLILLASSYVASTLPTQNPVASGPLASPVTKSHKKDCSLLSSERLKKTTKNENMCLLPPNKLFLTQHTHVHSCALSSSEEENNEDELSAEENVQYATSLMRLLPLCMCWRY